MDPRADLNNKYGRVEIRIDNEHAYVIEPILKNDSLNILFHLDYEH